MASTDARPVPQKNVAYRVTFPILDGDGDLVTGASSLDSEISKDAGTFADCTNEATEIATSSGIYYLDLTSTEMNADTVAIIVKTATSGAKTTVLVMYPEEAGDIRVNTTAWNGTAVASPHTAGYPVVTIKDGTGTGEIDTASGVVLAKDHTGASLATASALNTVDDFLDTEIVGLVSSVSALPSAAAIADAVWDEDATGHQTTGTFGQAIGDPVADTNTIYGAVVTGAAGATVAADIIAVKAETATILADTNELQTDWANGGRLDLILDARASQTSVDTIDDLLDTEIGALTTAVADLPTNAELATALGTADDAVLSAISAIDGKIDTIDNLIDTEVGAIKTQTDKLTFTVTNQIDANIQSINDVAVTGDGQPGTEFGV